MKNYGGACGADFEFQGRERLGGDGGNGAGGGSNPSIVGELGSATEAHLYTRELNKCAWRGIMR